jgi:hypothetical protein
MRAWSALISLSTARLRPLAMFAGLILAATALSACQNSITLPGPDVDYCTIIADPPVKVGSHLDAPGRFRCDGKGAGTITMTVTLQRQTAGGSWKSLTSGKFVAHGRNTTRALSESARTRRVPGTCGDGVYRSLVHAVEKSKGHTQVYNNRSVTVPNPCKASFG